MRTLLILSLISALCACQTYISPERKFVIEMTKELSRSASSKHSMITRKADSILSQKKSVTGHIEYEFHLRATCHYFLLVEPETNIVVGWRYEGKRSDCAIPLKS